MLHVYLYYPDPKISTHSNSECNEIQKMGKSDQRTHPINRDTISEQLRMIHAHERPYQFSSYSELNDMWLQVDFQDAEFEEAVVHHIHRLISQHYKPFGRVSVIPHC